ncbi:hypothetical protein D9Q98_002270 [Chlorella vulgaris]|uniref:Uncharacterized protein n=1 Tax=Chlorella vulgaris TaxID=3077 RepID=A0A9D4Z0K4_CHLVU|nr:hypothetical protein D9Q98_002270 [Chlorella vulgaris]
MAPANQKLQLLADALALEFSQSLASEQCAAALKRLLPGLDYLSIAVTNPAQAGSIVASANCATEGPTTLHLHDSLRSVVGLAVTCGQPVQSSLLGNESSAAAGWTDVQQMVAAVPSVTHLLCLPFGCTGGNAAAGDAGSNSSEDVLVCQQHAASGSGTGALLFGLSQAPSLDSRRAALLGALAACLPAPMAALSGNTLAFVNLACGNTSQCTCCCGLSSEEEEEEAGTVCGGCTPGSGNGDGDDHDGTPGAALPLPLPSRASGSSSLDDQSGPSSSAFPPPGTLLGASSKAAAAAVRHEPPGQLPHSGGGPQRFSKALLAAVGDSEAVVAQNALTLSFRTPLVEREYSQWVTRHHLKQGDVMTSLLLFTALAIVAFTQPHRLAEHSPATLAIGLGAVLPLCFSWGTSTATYLPLRTVLIAAFRLYCVSFINVIYMRSYQARLGCPALGQPHARFSVAAHLAPERMLQWVAFWRLTGAESLCITCLGFRCFPQTNASVCFNSSAAMAAVFGFLVPTACVRLIEQRSRSLFASRLLAAAA